MAPRFTFAPSLLGVALAFALPAHAQTPKPAATPAPAAAPAPAVAPAPSTPATSPPAPPPAPSSSAAPPSSPDAVSGAPPPTAAPAPEATATDAAAGPELPWHSPPEQGRFALPAPPPPVERIHFIPALEIRPFLWVTDGGPDGIDWEAALRLGSEDAAGTLGLVTIGGEANFLLQADFFGYRGVDVSEKDGMLVQVLVPNIEAGVIFADSLVLRAGSGLTGFRISKCTGKFGIVAQLRVPMIDVWLVPDNDFEDPQVSVGGAIELGVFL